MSPAPLPDGAARRHRWTLALVVGLIGLALVFQIADTTWLPLHVWDESRLAVNAIEMLASGNHLATSYGFVPDLWNTKPPLVINLMALSMQVFGTTPFALRLPATLSAVAVVVLIGWFVRRETGSLGCGIAAGVLLLASPLLHGMHGGQTGDYDAPLTLLTTGYSLLLFVLIHSERPRPGLALAAGLLVGLAILAKSVAGLVPGVGIAAYALIFGWRTLPRHIPDYLIVIGIGLAIGGGYYLLRGAGFEDADGGAYLAAVQMNDLGGRFESALDTHVGGPGFYLQPLLRKPPGMLAPLLLGLALLPAGRARRFAGYALCQFAGILMVFTIAATKLYWYIIPALPMLAAALAIGGYGLVLAARRRLGPRAADVLAALLLIAVAANAVRTRYLLPPLYDPPPRAFDRLIAVAAVQAPGQPLVIIDTGYANKAGLVDYTPVLRFHRLAAAMRGIAVDQAKSVSAAGPAALLGACDPDVVLPGDRLWSGEGCVLVRR